jgi:hypothetical protein
MPLDVVYGESRNRGAAQALAAQLRAVVDEGTVYLAYPVLACAGRKPRRRLWPGVSRSLLVFVEQPSENAPTLDLVCWRGERDHVLFVVGGT